MSTRADTRAARRSRARPAVLGADCFRCILGAILRSPLLALGVLGVGVLAAGCRSKPITAGALEDADRAKVFAAARAVLKKRFGTFTVLDEDAGRLVTSPRMPRSQSTSRFLAQVEVSEDSPPEIKIEVVVEVLSFQENRVVWTRYPRDDAQKAVEGYILEEIRARLEDRKPDLPNLDDLAPPPVEHRVPATEPAPRGRTSVAPGTPPQLPSRR